MLGILVTALTTVGYEIKNASEGLLFVPSWSGSAVTAFFILSLAVNTLLTALIVYKIVAVYRDIRGFNTGNLQTGGYGNGQRDLYPLISILVESGLITFVGQLAQSIMYKTSINGFPLIGGGVVILYVRSFLSIDDFKFIYLPFFFTGDFDDSCACACGDGDYIRS